MSSTQLIEQCATRLRGIVEALDNIHDNTPHRWSTDLDEVHSSAESLLAMIKDQAPARSETSFEEWLANELEGEDGQPVPAAVCDIALARRAFNHWPKLEQPAKVGGVRFSAGVSSRLVVEAAQRLCEFESTPEKEAERIERLQAFREQLDPLNLTPHAEAFNEAPAEALRPEQAEAKRPAVVGYRSMESGMVYEQDYGLKDPEALTTVAECDSIVGELRAEIAQLRQHKNDYMDAGQETYRALQNEIREREAEIARLDGLVSGRTAERDAALARVAELERGKVYVEARQCDECQHGGINDSATGVAACHECDWTGPEPEEDRCPGCQRENCMAAACPQCGARYVLVASEEIAAPVAQAQHSVPEISGIGRDAEHPRAVVLYLRNEPSEEDMRAIQNFLRAISADVLTQAQHSMPKAWLDVQAERRRQVEAEGWTPEHDDEHDSGELAAAGAAYALHAADHLNPYSQGDGGDEAPSCWPWHDGIAGRGEGPEKTEPAWWKPSTPRRDLVKACALALAEIERLDRAAATQGGPSDA
ncbi:TPA: hypothetical protein ACNRUW_001507 [Pseudomonas aeruginosa]